MGQKVYSNMIGINLSASDAKDDQPIPDNIQFEETMQ